MDSALKYEGRTSNNRADVAIPPTYEGSFTLSTSNAGDPSVERSSVDDPAKKGRKRSIDSKTTSHRLTTGQVYWDEKNAQRGEVIVSSSNGPVVLHL